MLPLPPPETGAWAPPQVPSGPLRPLTKDTEAAHSPVPWKRLSYWAALAAADPQRGPGRPVHFRELEGPMRANRTHRPLGTPGNPLLHHLPHSTKAKQHGHLPAKALRPSTAPAPGAPSAASTAPSSARSRPSRAIRVTDPAPTPDLGPTTSPTLVQGPASSLWPQMVLPSAGPEATWGLRTGHPTQL